MAPKKSKEPVPEEDNDIEYFINDDKDHLAGPKEETPKGKDNLSSDSNSNKRKGG